jgi:hypothetical protein
MQPHPGMKKAVIALLLSKERLEMHYYLSPRQGSTYVLDKSAFYNVACG